ncbi:LysR family transcriptional regulator [Conexibacter sp. DBS9H8]|uniref:LysR family transcriptional regulator n=1 Tax=Conexibacter sp. DBS9H8 TaxID=2937801 RepID=UPI00200EAF67|nr:LysR family transcriptional regulator [Conexibacter sp. DBS9H8]
MAATDHRLSDLTDLRLLVSVAECGSLGQAAARHGLSQPAVSARMTSLERRLGLTLLRRAPVGARVTPVGAEIVREARRVLAAADDLVASAERYRAESDARLRVAASFTVGEHLLPRWIGVLRARDTHISLIVEVINSTRVLDAVASARVDIGFVEGIEDEVAGIRSVTITTDELVVVVGPEHAWARRETPVSPAELAATGLIVRERGSGTREVLDSALERWGGIRPYLELGSSTALLSAARGGAGPAVLGRIAAEDDLSAGHVRLVPTTGVELRRTLRAVWPSDIDLSPLARQLLGVAELSASRSPTAAGPLDEAATGQSPTEQGATGRGRTGRSPQALVGGP